LLLLLVFLDVFPKLEIKRNTTKAIIITNTFK